MTEKELNAIEEYAITFQNSQPVSSVHIRDLIAAVRAECKASEMLAEKFNECPLVEGLWPYDPPQWCKDTDRPSPDASIAAVDCYGDIKECWLKWARQPDEKWTREEIDEAKAEAAKTAKLLNWGDEEEK